MAYAVKYLVLAFVPVTLLVAGPGAEDTPATRMARAVVGIESYGQGIWYSARLSYRLHEQLMLNGGYSYIDIPPGNTAGETVSFHIVPVSVSGLWRISAELPLFGELLFGGNAVIGGERTQRTGVRATVTGQPFTPVIGVGAAYLPREGGITLRAMLYIFQGIDSIGLESRRLPWLGGSIGYAF
ncbi:MAG: hypothetical protein OHK0011_04290 [Turneriella sp.]